MGVNGIYGLSGSGLDVESMVKAGMLSKQNQYDKMQQKYTKQQWEKEAFAEVYTDLYKFNYTTLSDYKLQKTTDAHQASSTNSDITATANPTAASMSHKIEVNAVASNAYMMSTQSITRVRQAADEYDNDAEESSIKLQDVLFKKFQMNVGNGNGDVAVFTDRFGAETTSTQDVLMSSTAFSITVGDGSKDNSGNEITKTVSYTYQELYDGKTFNDLVSDINGLGLNVRATYDSTNDRFSFYNKESGADNKVTLKVGSTDENGAALTDSAKSITSNFFNNLKILQSKDGDLYDSAGDKVNVDTTNKYNVSITKANDSSTNGSYFSTSGNGFTVAGADATVKVDGLTYSNLSGNKVSVSGVTYEWTAATTGSSTVTVSQDTDKIVENVKKFVEDYNKLLSSLYEKYDEKRPDKTYEPLTETQKEGMKDEQIEKWEEKAKQGLLYHNSTIGKVIDRMRDSISTPIQGLNSSYNSAYSIGISTTGLKGQLTLDEDKLKKALAADEDAAYNVIGRLSSEDDFEHNGLAQRLGDYTLQSISDVKDYAGTDGTKYDDDSDLGNLMKSLKEKMDNFKTMMEKFEEALYKKYDAMEVTLSQLGTQLSFITG